MSKINIRESLNRLDLQTDNKYDLRNTYDCSKISDDKKKKLAEALNKNASAKTISEILNESYDKYDYLKESLSEDFSEAEIKAVNDWNNRKRRKYGYKYYPEKYYGNFDIYVDGYKLYYPEDIDYSDSLADTVAYLKSKIKSGEIKSAIITDEDIYYPHTDEHVELWRSDNRFGEENYGYNPNIIRFYKNAKYTEALDKEELYKVVIQSGATKRDFESALYEDEAEEIVDYYDGRWIDENGFEWDMYVEEDDDSTEHAMIDNSYDMEDDDERAQREMNAYDQTDRDWEYVESLTEAIKDVNSLHSKIWNMDNNEKICFPNGYCVKCEFYDREGKAKRYIVTDKKDNVIIKGKFGFAWQPQIKKFEEDFFNLLNGRSVDEALTEANYGGAYDIEDDMFFTKEELVEFANDMVDNFSDWSHHKCGLEDVYMTDPKHLVIDVYDYDDGVIHRAEVNIDMRKIRTPKSIYRYGDSLLKQWKDSYLEYHEYDESLNESIDISDYEELHYPLRDGDKYYQLYRKIENGKGVWAAAELDKYGSDVVGEPFKITYEQARGFEPIEDSSIRKLSRDLGKKLLPKRENLEEQINLPGYAVRYITGYAGNGVNNSETEWFRTEEERDRRVKELEDKNYIGIKTWKMDNFYHTLPKEESLNEGIEDLDSISSTKAKDMTNEDFKVLKPLVDEYFKERKALGTWPDSIDERNFVKKWYKLADKCKEIAKNGMQGITGYGRLNDFIKIKILELARYVDNTFPWYVRNQLEKFGELDESLKEDIEDEKDFEYDDSDEVEEGVYFFVDGENYAWVERIAGPVHLDFDNWAVWSAREIVPIQDFIIGKNEQGGYDVDRDAYIAAINSKPIVYFVVDEDTGFIDWGPVETSTEAQDFLNSKVEDYENDEEYEEVEIEEESLTESINQNDVFKFLDEIKDTVSSFKNRVQEVSEYFNISEDEAEDFVYDWEQEGSLTESKAIKNDDDFEVTLHYDDIGNGKEYDYKLGYDEVVAYLKEIAWSNGDGPEDASEDEYLEWVMDNFDELSKKYELNVLDYFEDEASQYEYDHRNDEP